MSRWFRFYDDAINDPKVLRLSDAMFRAWVTLLCIASKNDGVLPPPSDVALMLRMKITKVAEWLAALTAAGLLDNTDGVFAPHNWNARQFKTDTVDETAAERMRRYRERKRLSDVTVTQVTDRNDRNAAVTVTVPRADTEQITDTEQRKKTRVAALPAPWNDGDFNEFWLIYPNKIGKADAQKAFLKAVKKVEPKEFFPALQSYANKTDDRPFCNPATWLNQERWLDQPAANPNGRRTVQQAADDLLTKLRAFDEPAPDGLRDRESQDVVRLLPPRRCE